MIAYVIPTRDRHEELSRTLRSLASLGEAAHEPIGGARVIVLDNASAEPADAGALGGALPATVERLGSNEGAAARNRGVEIAAAQGSEWVVMLDDDSSPIDAGFIDEALSAPADVAAIGADIVLPSGKRESGGLPEVFVGCGAAVRTDAFLRAGGYDAGFGYYAEEYDLCAKLIAAGHRIAHSVRFRVEHRKAETGRKFAFILEKLVENNAKVIQRYTPDAHLRWYLRHTLERYERIAAKEGVADAFRRAADRLDGALGGERRAPLSGRHWERFTGLAAAEETMRRVRGEGLDRAAVAARGKHDWCVEEAASRGGVALVEPEPRALTAEGKHPMAAVIGTLSPGPMLDAAAACAGEWSRVVMPWRPEGVWGGAAVAQ